MAKDKTKPITPTGLAAEIVSPTIVDLTWNAASDPSKPGEAASGVKGYRLFRDATKIADLGPVLTYSDTGRVPTRTYKYSVASVDNRNNQSLPSAQVKVTMPSVAPDAPDTTAPSVPTNVTATVQGTTAINLTWTASTDPAVVGQVQSGLAGYKVFRDQALITTLGLVTTYNDTGLTADTEYAYRVSARDVAGNESAGTAVSATTDAEGAAPDTTAPSVPTGLAASAVSSSQINASWNAATDPTVSGQITSGVAGYKLYRGGSLHQTLGLVTSYQDTGLTAATQYQYRIASRDAAGNESAQSAQVAATTQTASGGGANEIVAASASLAHVQAAVNSAQDGATILIPNGTATWTGGISTTKQIRIRAQNYTPTSGGTGTRSVTIANNSSSPLLHFQTGNSFHVGIAGIRFNEGTGLSNHVRFTGTGSKVPLINDCYFQSKQRNGSNIDVSIICMLCLGGVIWNCVLTGRGFAPGAIPVRWSGVGAFI